MRHYVDDPDNPGKEIDVIDLQKRNPYQPLPPDAIPELLKRDRWTRRDALLILAGYHPRNVVDGAGHPIGTIGAGVVYLDGLNQAMLYSAGLQHPMQPQMLYDFLTLTEYANGPDKEKSPQEWLAWAKEKDFTPYWLEYMGTIQSAPAPKNEPKAPQVEIQQDGQAETAGKTLTRPAIRKMFSKLSEKQWRGRFSREGENGLGDARIGEPRKPKYVVNILTDWLVNKGHYTPSEIKDAIEGKPTIKEGAKMADLKPSVTNKGTW